MPAQALGPPRTEAGRCRRRGKAASAAPGMWRGREVPPRAAAHRPPPAIQFPEESPEPRFDGTRGDPVGSCGRVGKKGGPSLAVGKVGAPSSRDPLEERRCGCGGPGADGGQRRPREPQRFGLCRGVSKH